MFNFLWRIIWYSETWHWQWRGDRVGLHDSVEGVTESLSLFFASSVSYKLQTIHDVELFLEGKSPNTQSFHQQGG